MTKEEGQPSSKTESLPRPRRLHLLDELRGFAVLCMVAFHGFFTLGELFGSSIGTQLLDFFTPVEPFFAGGFILLSGICCHLSRSNLKRGLKLLGIAVGLSLVTFGLEALGLSGVSIWFGVLHLLAFGMLCFGLLRPLLGRCPMWVGLIAFLLLFLFTYSVPEGRIGFLWFQFPLPDAWFESSYLFFLGFPSAFFSSADYFPLIPWLFLFLSGTFLGRTVAKGNLPALFYRLHSRFFSWIGRHALVIYLLHQPVLYLVFLGLSQFISFS